ncbi:ENTH domain-containing protein [Cinnamomum micranthum f. kanehirae]|uniref:ENTH domain-containing protein n=1 Tax=Cinnamomum micranthum f. kanehirae TaxID=337451 RepID=A0A443P5N2_9MAGN|nr:ENTH domain-containing protein [Cinnamomum micranthum f. kanehirae]
MGLVRRAHFFHGFKKHASLLFKKTIRMARLVLTDVTPAELLTRAATNRSPRIPDQKTMALISRAAFEIEDYWRIVAILHKRLSRFNKKHWRKSYKALILLEYLLIHGPKSIAADFQSDTDDIKRLGSFQYNDKAGFNWGPDVRNKTERILQLLGNENLLKEERNRVRQLIYGIEGWSFGQQSMAPPERVIQHESCSESSRKRNSHFNEQSQQENSFSSIRENLTEDKGHQTENSDPWENFDEVQISPKTSAQSSRKNNVPRQSSSNIILTNHFLRKPNVWDNELKPLLGSQEA